MTVEFGLLLREFGLPATWTQDELAEKAGVSRHPISMLEARRRSPRASSVVNLAVALGLDEAARGRLISTARTLDTLDGAADAPASSTTEAGGGRSVFQLPVDNRVFTGREPEVDQLLALAESARGQGGAHTVVISAIDGMGGVGKSALAVHVAHRLWDRFPDGQLFIDLHGYTQRMARGPARSR